MRLHGVAVIGCGRMGERRVRALLDSASLRAAATVVVCVDVDLPAAERLARVADADATTDWRNAILRPEVDIVIVATPHHLLATIAAASAEAGRHVLVEKPGGRDPEEIDLIATAASASDVKVAVGYNHRQHPAIRRLRKLLDDDAIGPVLYLRARYGHGGRPGYERDWRADRTLSGGGQTIDQGSHLIDLSAWLLDDVQTVSGTTATYFWDMEVEDNTFMLLTSSSGQVAQLHASWTEWKNLFSLEVFGRDGKLEVTGLGGSYGNEQLTLHRMLAEMGPPDTTVWVHPGPDDSLEHELSDLIESVRLDRAPQTGLGDARTVLEVVRRLRSIPHPGTPVP